MFYQAFAKNFRFVPIAVAFSISSEYYKYQIQHPIFALTVQFQFDYIIINSWSIQVQKTE